MKPSSISRGRMIILDSTLELEFGGCLARKKNTICDTWENKRRERGREREGFLPSEVQGLDTQNPILVIDNKLKLIGEYQETIGTCFVFSESVDGAPVLHEEMRPSEANIEKPTADANQASARQVKPIAHLHKILKFRLLTEEKTDSDGFNSKN